MKRRKQKLTDADRRWLIAAGGMSALLSLAGCQSVFPTGSGVIEARTGEEALRTIRSEHGLPRLSPDSTLEKAALQQAGYMARSRKMEHTTARGRDFASRMKSNGVEGAAAENIAHGGMAPGKLFSMWMDLAGHRRNMLDPRFEHFGLASVADAEGRRYWALVLGR